jgi:hypothetical protein
VRMRKPDLEPKEPPARLAGALLGAAIPAITVMGIFVALYTLRWCGLAFSAVSISWPHLGWTSAGFAAVGLLVGFDRLLDWISPLWGAITWFWNKHREVDARIDHAEWRIGEWIYDNYFSLIFCFLLVALLVLWVLRPA